MNLYRSGLLLCAVLGIAVGTGSLSGKQKPSVKSQALQFEEVLEFLGVKAWKFALQPTKDLEVTLIHVKRHSNGSPVRTELVRMANPGGTYSSVSVLLRESEELAKSDTLLKIGGIGTRKTVSLDLKKQWIQRVQPLNSEVTLQGSGDLILLERYPEKEGSTLSTGRVEDMSEYIAIVIGTYAGR